jgi:hypothetical protein
MTGFVEENSMLELHGWCRQCRDDDREVSNVNSRCASFPPNVRNIKRNSAGTAAEISLLGITAEIP